MKYEVLMTQEAEENLMNLEKNDRQKVLKAFDIVENVDISAVYNKSLGDKLFEIKTDNIRSIYKYSKNQIIVVALIFIKKTQKTPLKYIEYAHKILKEYKL